jgi:hypothetical protein
MLKKRVWRALGGEPGWAATSMIVVGLVGEVLTCGPGGSPRLARTRR